MDKEKETICPWCQTEIVWDPEIGPEEQCPHCWNELGNYRSVNLNILAQDADDDDRIEAGEDEDMDAEYDDDADGDEWEPVANDSYGEMVQQCLDEQEEAPECPNCREFLLLAGKQTVDGNGYAPSEPAALGAPFLKPPYALNVYVCPSCFRFEYVLDEKDKLAMIDKLRQ